jgi:glycosyltransferase involved in cell wall biosynthesis
MIWLTKSLQSLHIHPLKARIIRTLAATNCCVTLRFMTRDDQIRQGFDKSMRLIEIGASYNPLLPKRDGWHTVVVDHTDQETLTDKYQSESARLGVPAAWDFSAIEHVDVIWRGGPLHDAFSPDQHGTFDGIVASHVAEHLPDLLGFLQSAAILLKPSSGKFFLALPDHRYCFDALRPIATTGDVLDGQGASRHTMGTEFDHTAYHCVYGGDTGWLAASRNQDFALVHPWPKVAGVLTKTHTEYVDCHKWCFTPASFQLIILELHALGLIPWTPKIEPQIGIEFWAWLERSEINLEAINERRLALLREIIMESKTQIAMIEPPPPEAPPVEATPIEAPVEAALVEETKMPTVSAVIPLYNGAKFIEESITSILNQTLPPCEIIVVNDGSTDNGAEIVQAMAEKHPIITLLHKENGGQSSARNFGVTHSKGDLIALLDQDDAWYTTHLEELIKPFLEQFIGRELGWVYSDLDEIDTQGRMINHRFLRTLPTPHPKTNMFMCLREDMFILPSASLISRKAFDAVGGFDERLSGYEDDDLFLRMFRAGYANIFLEVALSKWRIYPESSSYSYRMRRSRSIYARKLIAEYKDDPDRARFILRDVIIPRFYGHSIAEFVKAMKEGDPEAIEETRAEVIHFAKLMPEKKRQVFGHILTRMRTPKQVQMAYSARAYLRPIIRRFV